MTADYFDRGLTVEEYLEELRHYRSLVRKVMEKVRAVDTPVQEDAEALKAAIDSFPQPIRATVNTEDWCGDWICNMPVLQKLFDSVEVPFRVFRGSEHAELKQMYEKDGDTHIPAVSLWDGDGKEIVRWIEAPEKVAGMKDEWKSEHPQLMELYERQSEDKAAAKEFAKLYRSFLETMAEWYMDGMWNETVREIVAKAQDASKKQR